MSLPRRIPESEHRPGGWRRPLGRRIRVMGICAVIAMALIWPPTVLVGLIAVIGRTLFGRARTRSARRARQRQVERELPGAVSLLQLALAAGHSPREAIAVVGSYGRGAVAESFAAVATRLDAGAGLDEAVAATPGDDGGIGRTLRLLEQAERYGQRLELQLELLAADIRRRRIAVLDEQSQRLGVQLLFPLVLCILPAFLLLSLLPLIMAMLEGITW